jgi:hypothetical protein
LIAYPEEAKKLAGAKGTPPDSDSVSPTGRVLKKSRRFVKKIRRKREPLIRVQQKPLFIRTHDGNANRRFVRQNAQRTFLPGGPA